jgi:lipopolysaccharide cholinephosphotransferase
MTDNEFQNLKENLTLDDMKKIQLDMLLSLADFCDAHGLRYYITGGTLLGAVRHQGFIPWDDDIDVDMPRPDYEKLIKLTKGKLGRYRVVNAFENTENDALVLKIFDPTTVVRETVKTLDGYKNHYVYVFLDVFPLDGLPANKVIFKFHCMHVHFLVGLCRTAINGTSGRSLAKRLLRVPMLPIAKLGGVMHWKKRIRKICLKYDFDKSTKIGVLLSRNRFRDYLDKDKYLPYDDSLSFEGYHFHAPGSYKEHLTYLYGDYMQLPPEDKRNSGHKLVGKRIEI